MPLVKKHHQTGHSVGDRRRTHGFQQKLHRGAVPSFRRHEQQEGAILGIDLVWVGFGFQLWRRCPFCAALSLSSGKWPFWGSTWFRLALAFSSSSTGGILRGQEQWEGAILRIDLAWAGFQQKLHRRAVPMPRGHEQQEVAILGVDLVWVVFGFQQKLHRGAVPIARGHGQREGAILGIDLVWAGFGCQQML